MTGVQYTYSKGMFKPSLTIGPVFNIDLNSYFDIEHTMIADTLEIVQSAVPIIWDLTCATTS